MPLTLAQALNDIHYSWGVWPATLQDAQNAMAFNSDQDLISFLQAHKAQATGPTQFPEWALKEMGNQIGSMAAYLTIPELAPTIVMGVAGDKGASWSQDRIAAAVQTTDYYKQHNQTQLGWTTLSPADREAKVEQTMAVLSDKFSQLYGAQQVPDISVFRSDAEKIASGAETLEYWAYVWKRTAEATPNTPAAQAVTAAAQAAGKQGVDVSNLQQQLYDTWQQWTGTQVPLTDLGQWTQDVMMNRKSQADFLNYAKSTAASVYTNKPENVPYQTWATQPKNVIAGALELPDVNDNDLLLQTYLRPGSTMSLGDLKTAAMQDPRFDQTGQAKTMYRQAMMGVLSQMGFAP